MRALDSLLRPGGEYASPCLAPQSRGARRANRPSPGRLHWRAAGHLHHAGRRPAIRGQQGRRRRPCGRQMRFRSRSASVGWTVAGGPLPQGWQGRWGQRSTVGRCYGFAATVPSASVVCATITSARQPGARPPCGRWIDSASIPLRAITHAITEFAFHISPVPSSSRSHTGVGTRGTTSSTRRASCS
jgi:hypothetical protein